MIRINLLPHREQKRERRKRDMQVTLSGMAQSNERVAEFLRNLSERSAWLEKPQLEEIRENEIRTRGKDGEIKRAHEFRLNVVVKRQAPSDAASNAQVALNNTGAN